MDNLTRRWRNRSFLAEARAVLDGKPRITRIRHNRKIVYLSESVDHTIQGHYGQLVVHPSGEYTYTLNRTASPGDVDKFDYYLSGLGWFTFNMHIAP